MAFTDDVVNLTGYAHDAAKWAQRSFTIQFWTLLVALGVRM
jgi:hypothetical protein